MKATPSRRWHPRLKLAGGEPAGRNAGRRGLFQPSIHKDSCERSTSAVYESINAGLAVVRDGSPDGHGLHRAREDADRDVIRLHPWVTQVRSPSSAQPMA